MPYGEGTWVVDTRTGDVGQVMRSTAWSLSLQRPGNQGLWAAEPCSVRQARPAEVASAEAVCRARELRAGHPGEGTDGEPSPVMSRPTSWLVKLTSKEIAQKGKLHMEPTTVEGGPFPLLGQPGKDGSEALPLAETPQARKWRITTTSRHTVSGYLPPWAAEDPSEVDVPIEHLAARLVDVHHYADFDGQTLRRVRTTQDGGEPGTLHLLSGSIDCVPYAADPEPRVPTVTVNVTPECWLSELGPADVLALAEQLRAQADRLAYEVHPALLGARADWAAAHDEEEGAGALAVRPAAGDFGGCA